MIGTASVALEQLLAGDPHPPGDVGARRVLRPVRLSGSRYVAAMGDSR